MTARRIAHDQPESFAFTPESMREVDFWLAKYPEARKRSAVIPLLWIAQKQQGGWLPEPAMRAVAALLDMAYIRVFEVASFYTMFNLEPVGRYHIQLCGTTPCMLRGSEDLKTVLKDRIGPKGAVTPDRLFSWIEVECLGACCNAPMVQISTAESDHYYEDLTPELLSKLMDDLAAGRDAKAGPQIERQTSAPAGGPTTLTDPSLYDGSRAQPLKEIPNAQPASGEAG
jgi:NADH-quinone oxidoreductase subunit E